MVDVIYVSDMPVAVDKMSANVWLYVDIPIYTRIEVIKVIMSKNVEIMTYSLLEFLELFLEFMFWVFTFLPEYYCKHMF